MKSMVEVLASFAAKQPSSLCIAEAEASFTYEEIWTKTREIASLFVSYGYKPQDRIMVECTQDMRFLVINFACELAGLIFVPIEHKAAPERVREIYEETEASVFIKEADYEGSYNVMELSDLFAAKADSLKDFALPEADVVCEILFTTGTTGKSKGIEITNANNIAIAENIMYGTEMKSRNVELLPLPLSHSHGLRCAFANFLAGGAVVLLEGVMKVKLVFELMDRYQVTAMDISPSAALVLMRLSKGALRDYNDKLDYIQIGTAALPEETKQKMIELLPDVRLYNFYGSTESGRSCVLDFNAQKDMPNCIGKPTKNARFIVVDDDRNEIHSSEDEPGLIATAGAMNMKGYWRQPELTAETMENGFIYTNDLGYISEDGFVFVFGRKDDIINFKGIKIAPEEIEESVRKHPLVVDCACVPKTDKSGGQVPKLFVSISDADKFSKEELYNFLKDHIDGNKMPKEIEVIDEIPRTYNGKLQRKKLIGR